MVEKIVFLHAFDRSGSTAISSTIAKSSGVTLFMQPFNSGPVRERLNTVWNDELATLEDAAFLRNLENGVVDHSYIRSHWFREKSTATEFQPGDLHILKTTINHLHMPWSETIAPGIDHWAIWREPEDILSSLIRNDLINAWFGSFLGEVDEIITRGEPHFNSFAKFRGVHEHPIEAMALYIAVRNGFLFQHIKRTNVLSFEDFTSNSNRALKSFRDRYGLDMDSGIAAGDPPPNINLVGHAYEPSVSHRNLIPDTARDFATEVFNTLRHVAGREATIG